MTDGCAVVVNRTPAPPGPRHGCPILFTDMNLSPVLPPPPPRPLGRSQDPLKELLSQLAFIQLVYVACNALSSSSSGGSEVHPTYHALTHLEAMKRSEVFVMVLLFIIPLHKCVAGGEGMYASLCWDGSMKYDRFRIT